MNLTATITLASSQIPSVTTAAFSETTSTTTWWGGTSYSTTVIPACSAVSNWSAPVQSGGTWTSTATWTSSATCATTESSNGTGAFSATYSGGSDTGSSQANLGQTNTLTPSLTYGSNSQTSAGGCSNCYYGQSSSPDAEGDAFVKGSLSGQFARGPVGTFGGTSNLSGYVKHYIWNPLLPFVTPPSYLNLWPPSWALGSVTANTGSTTVCPPLFGIYVGTGAGGVVQDGPPSPPTGRPLRGDLLTIRPPRHLRRRPM